MQGLAGDGEFDLVARLDGRHVEFGGVHHAVEVVVEANKPEFFNLDLQVMATWGQQRQGGLAAFHSDASGQLPSDLDRPFWPSVVGLNLYFCLLALGNTGCLHTADDRSPVRHRQPELRWRSGSALGVSDGEVEV